MSKIAVFEYGKMSLAEWIDNNRDCEKMVLVGNVFYESNDKHSRDLLLDFNDIPVDAALKMDNVMQESLEPFETDKALPYSDTHLAGYLANRYDDSAENCSKRAWERVTASVNNAMRATAVGYTTVTKTGEDMCFTESDVRYALFPVWFLQVRYRDKTYPFAINGQTGKMSGKLPISPLRLVLWLLGLTAVIGTIAALIALSL